MLYSNPVHTHRRIKLIRQYRKSVLDELHLCVVNVRNCERGEREMVLHVKRLVPSQKSPKTRGKHAVASPTHTPILNTFSLLTRITNQEPKETGIHVITGGSER